MACCACLRSRKGKLALLLFICGLFIMSLLLNLWSSREGAVEIIYPVHRDTSERDILEVTIFPDLPVVTEGSSVQICCLVSGAVKFNFETPSLPDPLRSSVHTSTHEGGVVLTIERATAGHSGVYTCHAIGSMGVERTQTVELKVMAAGSPNDGPQELSAPFTPPSPKNAASSLYTASPSSTSHSTSSTSPSSTSPSSTSPSSTSPSSTSPSSTSLSSTSHSSTSHSSTSPSSTSPSSTSPSSTSHSSTSPSSTSPSFPSSHAQTSVVKRADGLADNRSQTFSSSSVKSFSFEDIGKFQRTQVDKFCQRHNLQHLKYSIPTPHSNETNFNRHILLDDEHRVLFCFVPGVGCANLKLLFFATQGAVPHSELSKSRDKVNHLALDRALQQGSFLSRNDEMKVSVLKSYFKFIMFRNPLERLASSYRSTIERFELFGMRDDVPPYNWLRRAIHNYTHPQLYSTWAQNRGNTPVSIEFGDFIEYWLVGENPRFNYDEYFLMTTDICQPCQTRFDFYGNFHHFDRDAQVLISKIGASSTDLRSGYYSEDTSTETRMQQYYSTLSEEQKRQVLKKMALELEFFYAVFPGERDSHKRILGVTEDLPQM